MLVTDFLLYMILACLAVACLECAVLLGFKIWGEMHDKYCKKVRQ